MCPNGFCGVSLPTISGVWTATSCSEVGEARSAAPVAGPPITCPDGELVGSPLQHARSARIFLNFFCLIDCTQVQRVRRRRVVMPAYSTSVSPVTAPAVSSADSPPVCRC